MRPVFVAAAQNASLYEIAAFLVVAAMVLLLKKAPRAAAPPVHTAVEV